MCHLLGQLKLTLGLPSWTLPDLGHFLWIWMRLEYKCSQKQHQPVHQHQPNSTDNACVEWERESDVSLIMPPEYVGYWLRTFSVGINLVSFLFFKPTSGVYPFERKNSTTQPLAARQNKSAHETWTRFGHRFYARNFYHNSFVSLWYIKSKVQNSPAPLLSRRTCTFAHSLSWALKLFLCTFTFQVVALVA